MGGTGLESVIDGIESTTLFRANADFALGERAI
jgi:hypothetical protein